jgi:Flp pilus assembly protein TadB
MAEAGQVLAVVAGALVAIGVIAAAGPLPAPAPPRLLRTVARGEISLAAAALPSADWRLITLAQAAMAVLLSVPAWVLTGLLVVAAAAGVAAVAGTRMALRVRAAHGVRARQDAVLESVRMLRGLLESGGVGVQQALAVLADRGPARLRPEFASLVAAGATGRQPAAWAAARARVDDPLFDMLCAAILVQRPAGGALAPLFADLEQSVAGIHEVAREAEALQVQARSAAALVVVLPLAFLLVLSALRSPYLDVYHTAVGSAFLASMLAVIGGSYTWVLRWLRLPAEPRLEVRDG